MLILDPFPNVIQQQNNERKISGTKRYHGNKSDEDKIQKKAAKNEEAPIMDVAITYNSDSELLTEDSLMSASNDDIPSFEKNDETMTDASESERTNDSNSASDNSDSIFSDNNDH